MKRLLILCVGGWLLAGQVGAQPTPVVDLFGVHEYPPEGPLDAVIINNHGTIDAVNTLFSWDTQNTLQFVNQIGGQMYGAPGFWLDHVDGDTFERSPLLSFTNLGSIFATTRLVISATNLANAPNALLSADRGGTVHLEALNGTMNLFNSKIRAGESSTRGNAFEGDFIINDTEYENPANVMDEYWGLDEGELIRIDGLSFGFSTSSDEATNRAIAPEGGLVTRLRNAFLSFNPLVDTNFPAIPGYSFYVTTNHVYNGGPATARTWRGVVQMVFVQTNLVNSPEVNVYFYGGRVRNNYVLQEVAVELGIHDQDPITGADFTRYLRLIDHSATNASAAGVGTPRLFANDDRVGTYRPDGFTVERTDYPLFGIPGFGTPAIAFDPAYIYYSDQRLATNIGARFETNEIPHAYRAYQFSIRPRDLGGAGTGVDYPTGFEPMDEHNDPTNSAGRVEIEANNLNLRLANIRADNLVSIKATNVTDMSGLKIDAQNVNLELYSNSGSVILSNATPTQVSRLNGAVTVWSSLWQVDQFVTNAVIGGLPGVFPRDGTNTINYTYHMMVVDLNNQVWDVENGVETFRSSQITTNQPLVFQNFRVNQPTVELHDTNTVTRSFYLGGQNWLVGTNGNFTLGGVNTAFTANNAPNLINFTNLGTISVPLSANFGYDRKDGTGAPAPYSNIVNQGTISSASVLFRTVYFQNLSNLFAIGGSLQIDARTNHLDGGLLYSTGNISLSGDEVMANGTNAPFGGFYGSLYAQGTLSINLTNRLTDSNLTNQWTVFGGFSLTTKPVKGDLLATRITSFAGTNQSVVHYWTADDRGDSSSGYANNSAVGELVLDGAPGSHFYFLPVLGQNNALYIDTLTLANNATNFSSALTVDPGMTVYFAHANVPGDKLTNAHPGRLVWVSPATRAGPLVAVRTSIARTMSMTTQDYQALLASSPDVDGDGIPNELDETPFSGFTISRFIIIEVPSANGQPARRFAQVYWQALAGSSYTVEYRDGLESSVWLPLGVFSAQTSGEMSAVQEMPSGGQRFYRVRYGQ